MVKFSAPNREPILAYQLLGDILLCSILFTLVAMLLPLILKEKFPYFTKKVLRKWLEKIYIFQRIYD